MFFSIIISNLSIYFVGFGLSNAEENVVDHVVKACQLATEQCAHKVMLVKIELFIIKLGMGI